MKIIDAIKRGFEIASKNLNLVLIVFGFNIIWNWAVIPFTPEAPVGVGAGITMTPGLTILSIIFVLISIFIQGGVLGSVKDIIKEGKLELGRFTGYGAKFYLRLLFLALIIVLIIGLIAFLVTLILAASAPTKNAVVIALTSILALIIGAAGLYIAILLFLSPYILVVEDIGIFQAMRMSIDFVKKVFLKILGLGVLLVLIGFGIGLIMGLIAGILSLVIKGKFLQVVTGVISGGVNAYLTILVTSCIVTYYLAMKGKESEGASSTTA